MPESAPQEKIPKTQDGESLGLSGDKSGQVSEGACIVSTSPTFSQQTPVLINADDSQVWGENCSYWKTIKAKKDVNESEILTLTKEMEGRLRTGNFLAFDEFRQPPREKKFIQIDRDQQDPIWFVGDLHGDWLGLESVLRYIEYCDGQKNEKSIVTFLGDLFDRTSGENGANVLFRVLKLIKESPGRISFIVGNHDEGLTYEDKFASSVYPGGFADWLNGLPKESPWIELAKVAIKFFEYAPRALLLPDGLLVAHGGVPHTDLLNQIRFKDDLGKQEMLDDFVWTRLHENAKVRIPNRTTRGCSLGIDDFNRFCKSAEKVLERRIIGMLRGHDHYDERYRHFEKYQAHPVLTINTFCYRQDGDQPDPPARPAVIAKWNNGSMPVVHILEIPHDLVADIYSSQISEQT